MKLINLTLSLATALFFSTLITAADPTENPQMSAILAQIQARAAKQIAENKAKSPQSTTAAPLRQGVHVRTPSIEDRMNMLMEKQRATAAATASQPIPPFLMRADGRPLGSGVFTHSQRQGTASPIKEIKGCIKIDQQSDDVPQFKIYFEGMETSSNDEGFFSFPVDGSVIEKYGIIICNKIKHTFGRHNTVDSFGLIPDMNYKYYRFSRNTDGGGTWTQQEPDLRQKNLRIPRNAVVIALNPAYFDHLDTSWPGDFGSGTLKLPRIVLKAGHEKKIERKAIKSLLYGLDMSPFHTTVKHTIKEVGDCKAELLLDRAT